MACFLGYILTGLLFD